MQKVQQKRKSGKLQIRVLDFQSEIKGNLLGLARVLIPGWCMVISNIRVHLSGDRLYVSNLFTTANAKPSIAAIPSAAFINERGRGLFESALIPPLEEYFEEHPVQFEAV
jgi:hypothetical protein